MSVKVVKRIHQHSKKPAWARGRKSAHGPRVRPRRGRPENWRVAEARWIAEQRSKEGGKK